MIASSPSEVEVSGCRLSMHMNVTLYQYHNIFTKETISAFLCFPPPGIINPTIMIHGRRTFTPRDGFLIIQLYSTVTCHLRERLCLYLQSQGHTYIRHTSYTFTAHHPHLTSSHPRSCTTVHRRIAVLRSTGTSVPQSGTTLHDEYGENSILNTEYVDFQGQM